MFFHVTYRKIGLPFLSEFSVGLAPKCCEQCDLPEVGDSINRLTLFAALSRHYRKRDA